jgi:hypothetical protein
LGSNRIRWNPAKLEPLYYDMEDNLCYKNSTGIWVKSGDLMNLFFSHKDGYIRDNASFKWELTNHPNKLIGLVEGYPSTLLDPIVYTEIYEVVYGMPLEDVIVYMGHPFFSIIVSHRIRHGK